MKYLIGLLALLTPFLNFAADKGLDEKIDEGFGSATGWFVEAIFYLNNYKVFTIIILLNLKPFSVILVIWCLCV